MAKLKTLTIPIKTISQKKLLDALNALDHTDVITMLEEEPDQVLAYVMDISDANFQYQQIGDCRYAVLNAYNGKLEVYDALSAVNKLKKKSK